MGVVEGDLDFSVGRPMVVVPLRFPHNPANSPWPFPSPMILRFSTTDGTLRGRVSALDVSRG